MRKLFDDKIKTVLFDMDGTLLNTLDDLMESVNHALRKNSLPERNRDEIRRFVGNGIQKLVERALPDDVKNDINVYNIVYDCFRAYYAEHSNDRTCPYDGILPAISKFKSAGYKMAIVSNKPDAALKKLCDIYFSKYIDISVGYKQGMSPKPAPDAVYEALQLLDSNKENAVFIGDSEVDSETARNSGLPFVGCLWGFRDRKTLENNGCEVFVNSPEQLVKLFCV